jgi:hypothetical protein
MHENPVKRKTGAASERLAVEQLVALREARTWIDPNRRIGRAEKTEKKTRTLKN